MEVTPMADIIQIRRDTAALWNTTNPILAAGEFGYENDTTKLKIGDGTSTWTSLGYYTLLNDGITSTAAELNILDGVTSTTAELNILDGVTSTTADLNILDGVTSTTAELNILDGVTSTTAELNYVDGVTSNVQTQFNNLSTPTLQATATGAITAGKPCKINSDGTVSQISATALTVSNHNYRAYESQHWDTKPFTYASLATGAYAFVFSGPGVCWDNHRNQFVVIGWDTYIKCYISVIGQIKNGTVLWGQVHKILESEYHDSSHSSQNENGKAIWYDENFDRIVFIDEPYGRMAVGIPQEDGGYYWGHRAGTSSQQYDADQYFETEYFNGEAIILKRKNNDDLEIECATITQDYMYASNNAKRTIREKRCNTTDQEFTSTACATMALDRTNGEVCVAATKGPTTQPWGVYLLDLDPAGDKSQNPSVLYDSGEGTSGDKDYLNVTYISPKKYLLTYQNSSGKASAQVLTFSGSTPTYHTAVQLNTQDSKNTWVTVTKEQIFVRWHDYGASLTIDGSNDITVGTVEAYSGKLEWTVLANPGKQFAYSPVSDVGLLFMYDGAGEARGFSTSTFHPNTYIGIAQATVANAATATLDIAGGINAQQSGLTIGKKYYVHYDGSIGTERSDVYAGMSTSATKLLVKG
jgi:hypothetical protein